MDAQHSRALARGDTPVAVPNKCIVQGCGSACFAAQPAMLFSRWHKKIRSIVMVLKFLLPTIEQ
jgi:hypothetical protein